MPKRPSVVDSARHGAHAATAHASEGVEKLARFGYAAKGVVYVLVGVLAVQVAIGVGGRTTDPRGALTTLLSAPFGQVLLALVALGLVGYAIWRFVEAWRAPEGEKAGKRLGYALTGIIYSGLALSAARLAWPSMPAGGGGGGRGTQGWTAWLMSQPFGQWLVGLVGVAIIAYGLYELYRAVSEKFKRQIQTQTMEPQTERWVVRVGKLGLAARGVTFGIIGWFLIQAALQAEPGEARGLGGALATLAAQPWGQVLLGIVALGLVAYGLYQFVLARYRRIAPAMA